MTFDRKFEGVQSTLYVGERVVEDLALLLSWEIIKVKCILTTRERSFLVKLKEMTTKFSRIKWASAIFGQIN